MKIKRISKTSSQYAIEIKSDMIVPLMENRYDDFNEVIKTLKQEVKGIEVKSTRPGVRPVKVVIHTLDGTLHLPRPQKVARLSFVAKKFAAYKTQKAVMKLVYEAAEKATLEKKDNLTVSMCYMNEKLRQSFKGLIISIVVIFASLILSFFVPSFINLFFASILLSLIIVAHQELLRYRIENGFFGTNYYEAKQLLEFISENKDKFDGGKKVFNPEGIDEVLIRLGDHTFYQKGGTGK